MVQNRVAVYANPYMHSVCVRGGTLLVTLATRLPLCLVPPGSVRGGTTSTSHPRGWRNRGTSMLARIASNLVIGGHVANAYAQLTGGKQHSTMQQLRIVAHCMHKVTVVLAKLS